jgi:hypothetical protein
MNSPDRNSKCRFFPDAIALGNFLNLAGGRGANIQC